MLEHSSELITAIASASITSIAVGFLIDRRYRKDIGALRGAIELKNQIVQDLSDRNKALSEENENSRVVYARASEIEGDRSRRLYSENISLSEENRRLRDFIRGNMERSGTLLSGLAREGKNDVGE